MIFFCRSDVAQNGNNGDISGRSMWRIKIIDGVWRFGYCRQLGGRGREYVWAFRLEHIEQVVK